MQDTMPLTFGQWLRQQRKTRDLTQEELADRIGCSPWAIQKIEVGSRRPSRQMVELLAEYFAVPDE
ncbi:MAG TPA: helix-turn-helix transcriptional regulator, partial [Chloroflexia bacterium]|nr:helix-turn-helix transcriptional regulator [Chloroflexia bacterium]